LGELRRFRRGDLAITDDVFPKVVVICSKCGYTMLFNALVLGLSIESRGSDV